MRGFLDSLQDKSLARLVRVNVMLPQAQLNWMDELVEKLNAQTRAHNKKVRPRDRRPPVNRSHILRVALTIVDENFKDELRERAVVPRTIMFLERRKATTPPPE
ncbi:MAG: hypothetical protein ACT4TC_21940 [Myxococcaceae bacterium]